METIGIMQNAIPIRSEFERAVSYLKCRQTWRRAATPTLRWKQGATTRTALPRTQDLPSTEMVTQIGLSDLGGPMLFLVATAVISLAITRFGKRLDKRSGVRSSSQSST